MMCFVKKPNLPSGKVKTVICGADDEGILHYLKSKDISVIKSPPNPYIDKAVSSHADMAVLYLGDGNIVVDKNQKELVDALGGLNMNVFLTQKSVSGEYPDDVLLNFAFCDKYIIGNFAYCDVAVSAMLDGYNKIQVRQGYCKCSVLIVSDKAIITDDVGIHKNALKNDIDSLLIDKGDIALDGHSYGFIGGASCKISDDTVLFFGDIKRHRDFKKIREFIFKHGKSYDCTDDNELRDIGGIIPVIEQV